MEGPMEGKDAWADGRKTGCVISPVTTAAVSRSARQREIKYFFNMRFVRLCVAARKGAPSDTLTATGAPGRRQAKYAEKTFLYYSL